MLDYAGYIGFFTATVASNSFCILYTVFARWWKTDFGRHLFIFTLVEALLLDFSLLGLIIGVYSGQKLVGAILLPSLGTILVWRNIILIRAQVVDRRASKTSGAKNYSCDTDPDLASSTVSDH